MKIKNFYKFGKNYLKKKEKNIMGGGGDFLLKKINKCYRVNV